MKERGTPEPGNADTPTPERPKRYEEMNSTELLREALELGIENAQSMDAMQLEAAIRKARR